MVVWTVSGGWTENLTVRENVEGLLTLSSPSSLHIVRSKTILCAPEVDVRLTIEESAEQHKRCEGWDQPAEALWKLADATEQWPLHIQVCLFTTERLQRHNSYLLVSEARPELNRDSVEWKKYNIILVSLLIPIFLSHRYAVLRFNQYFKTKPAVMALQIPEWGGKTGRSSGTRFMLGLPVGCGLSSTSQLLMGHTALSNWLPLLQQAQLTLSFLQS